MRGNYESAKLLLDEHSFKETISATLDYAISPISSNNIDIIKLLIEKDGRLSEYYYDYLFDIKSDFTSKYDREELRNFYQQHISLGTNQIYTLETIENDVLLFDNAKNDTTETLSGDIGSNYLEPEQ
jgi:hypothetical protein